MTDYRDTHPAPGVAKSLWFGPEVEGSLKGLYTAFLPDLLVDHQWKRLLDEPGVDQLFFTETFRSWAWLDQKMEEIVARGYIMTKGVMARDVPQMLRLRQQYKWARHVKLIVRYFDAPWALDLMPQDQVSIGVAYKMLTMKVDGAVATTPEMYQDDKGAF